MDTQTKHKEQRGKLFIVATPIGNLQDMTFRAVDTLKHVDVIACEDTRTSRKLLDFYGIGTQLIPCHDHNENKASRQIMGLLLEGKDVALISDAGTPLINDPGYHVVHLLRKHAFDVVTIPGASSPIAALAASGLPTDIFTYLGFLPRKGKARSVLLERIQQAKDTQVFLESPKRILKTLQALQCLAGMDDRPCVVGRELTKMYEEFIHGTLQEVVTHFEAHDGRGEMVVMIGAGAQVEADDAMIQQALDVVLARGLSASASAKQVAKDLHISRSRVYALIHPKAEEK
ncbi:16S rRNA (cytidine(1402)-2'-O)-methyltransferase [Ghiorsea bivora]|uniref:16S rRNA (cytidine(1402)-2'-O)-methyltransferase n=1 Tax=Ghiorsea bivora TaxID=1485545 RepID=UPI00056EC54A|nr:16S rRNA (cytidine(1402)-2'-O)-methyltransferase [Ghiorsea bivora]